MDAADRLRSLIRDLTSDDGYITGRRSYPRTVAAADALTIAGKLQAGVDSLTEQRAAEVAARGHSIACKRGCNRCCVNAVMVFLPEAMRIADWLRLPENLMVRERFLAAYPAWRERSGDAAERLSELSAEGDLPAYAAEHLAYGKRGAMCAFNHEGACSIYEVRPNLCRDGHALDTNAHCDPATAEGRQVQSLTFIPLRDFLAKSRSLHLALHHALGGKHRRTTALCRAVYDLIQPPAL